MLAGELVGAVHAAVARGAQRGLVGAAEHRRRLRRAHVALHLHPQLARPPPPQLPTAIALYLHGSRGARVVSSPPSSRSRSGGQWCCGGKSPGLAWKGERYVGAVSSYTPRGEIARGDLRANPQRLGGCCCLLSEVWGWPPGIGIKVARSRAAPAGRSGDEMR